MFLLQWATGESWMSGENLDIYSGDDFDQPAAPAGGRQSRRFLGIQFACCDVYARIYVNRSETAYEGNCPKCGKPVCILIGEGGTDKRFFIAY
jgi:hypothetical protein